ncbi:type II toxin-antitoxin system PemK/MazF family toxin [Paenibacillus dendritiformis]|uniref:type II toxin-antitoxin system PemK/MazF family toxin n=1 Tax=Paenibacillus dendritiformis TaxID=130049 RepID=UPI00387E1D72
MNALVDKPNTLQHSEYKQVKKYEIWMCEMRPGSGSEQVGTRPCIVLSNNIGNKYSPTVLVAPLTSSIAKTKIPTHVMVSSSNEGLERDSTVLLEQIVTLNKSRLKYKICVPNEREKCNIDTALLISFGMFSA